MGPHAQDHSSMGWKRALIAGAVLVIGSAVALTMVLLYVDVPAPQASACITTHQPGREDCVRFSCGSVMDPSIPSRFERQRGTSPSAQQVCDAAYDTNRLRAGIIAVAGTVVGLALFQGSRRGRFSDDSEKPTIQT